MPKLRDTHLVILSAAAGRTDGSILPLPDTLRLNKGAVTLVLKGLLRRGLMTEGPASRDDQVWRQVDDRPMTLAITDTGLTAIGVVGDAVPNTQMAPSQTNRPKPSLGTGHQSPDKYKQPDVSSAPIKTGAKQALLVDLLSRKEGASITDICTATGWQTHSVRGAISGTVKRKLSLKVTAELSADRGRIYRIVPSSVGGG